MTFDIAINAITDGTIKQLFPPKKEKTQDFLKSLLKKTDQQIFQSLNHIL